MENNKLNRKNILAAPVDRSKWKVAPKLKGSGVFVFKAGKAHRHVHEHGKSHVPTDKIGIFLSTICLLHCLLGPLLVIFIPSLGSELLGVSFHWLLLVFVVPFALYSFLSSYRTHKIKTPLKIGSIGILFLSVGVLTPEFLGHTEPLETMETAFTVLGGVFLAYAHYINLKQCQCRD